MRVALKIAYDGRLFHGFARQPDLRTVEGEVRFALEKSRLVVDADLANVRGSSRTDAGVSALGNAIAFDTSFSGDEVVGRLNDTAKDVWAWAIASVPDGFDPRRANSRWYRYVLSGEHDLGRLRDASRAFVGSHDFAAFARPDATRTRRHIDSIEMDRVDDATLVDVRAPSFIRGMVRRIVAGMLAVERRDATAEDLSRTLSGELKRDFGEVSPEALILMDVDLGIPFRPQVDRATRLRIQRSAFDAWIRARFWREAWGRASMRDESKS